MLCLAILAALIAGVLSESVAASASTRDWPTMEEIAEARETAQADETLDGAVREQILSLLTAAERSLEVERGAAQRLLELQQELAGLPGQREAISTELAQMVDAPVVVPPEASLDRLRAERDEAEANLRAAVDRQASLERELALRAERRSAIPDELAALEDALEDIDEAIATGQTDLPAPLATARSWALETQRAEVVRRLAALRAEMTVIDARPEIAALRRERAARRIGLRESALRQWQTIVADAATRQAERDALEARRIAAEASPAVRGVAERTVELIERRVDPTDGIVVKNAEIAEYLDRVQLRLARLARQYDQDRQRVLDTGMVGLTNQRLRRQRQELPDLRVLSRGRGQLRHELARAQRELTDLEFEHESMPQLLAQRTQILDEFLPAGEVADDNLVVELDRQLVARQRALESLIVEYRQRDEMLLQMQDRLIPLRALTEAYIDFIDERILWIRSMDAINVREVRQAWEAIAPLVEPASLQMFGRSAFDRLMRSPVIVALLIVGTAGAAWAKVKLRRRGAAIAALVAKPRTDSIALTIEATLLAVVWAALWPAALWIVSWLIGNVADPSGLGPMISTGLAHLGWMVLILRLVGELTRRDGLAIAHYGWRPESCAMLRRHLRWFGPLAMIAIFFQGAMEFEQSRVGTDSLARVATMVLSAGLAVLLLRLMGPRRGLFVGVIARSRAPWLERLIYLVYPITVGIPVAMIVLDALGFSFSVNQLQLALFQTAVFGICALLVGGLVTRWLLITRQRLAMEEARKRRAAASSGEIGSATSADGDAVSLETETINLVAIDAQTRQLMRTGFAVTIAVGLFLIWSKLLPALGMLERIELWPHFGSVREISVAPPPLESVIGAQALAEVRRTSPLATGSFLPVFTAAGMPIAGSLQQPQQAETADPTSAPPVAIPPATPPATTPPGVQAPGRTGDAVGSAAPPPATTGTARPPATDVTALMMGTPRNGAAVAEATVDDRGRVTVANLLAASLITLLAILISRNIPGLLEILLLQRLPLTASARYAISALTRYVIAVFAIFLAFGAIGIGWSQVQWLVAAATVGVGFGLQEIVANFISGVIILFEQPIRVGDTVTVGNVSGTVTKIRMRATTITDWDRKELLIPNREFITGQVINWTLSDPTLRLVVSVGIAYGSDTATAERILLEAARNHPIVLRDPAPSVVFTRFGESSLDFDLRAFLPSIEHLVRVRHDLHNAIDRAFRAAKIEIAFPQRDLHVRDIAGSLQIGRRGRLNDLDDDGPKIDNPVTN